MRCQAAILLAAAAFTGGCGSTPSSAEEFEGEERAVAQAVEELQEAGTRRDAAKVCRDLLTRSLRDEIAEGASSCDREIEKALKDADAFELEVQEVTVSGETAQARVRGDAAEQDTVRTLRLQREDGRWRISAF